MIHVCSVLCLLSVFCFDFYYDSLHYKYKAHIYIYTSHNEGIDRLDTIQNIKTKRKEIKKNNFNKISNVKWLIKNISKCVFVRKYLASTFNKNMILKTIKIHMLQFVGVLNENKSWNFILMFIEIVITLMLYMHANGFWFIGIVGVRLK